MRRNKLHLRTLALLLSTVMAIGLIIPAVASDEDLIDPTTLQAYTVTLNTSQNGSMEFEKEEEAGEGDVLVGPEEPETEKAFLPGETVRVIAAPIDGYVVSDLVAYL